MKTVFSLLLLVAAVTVAGCEKESSNVVGSGDEDKVAEYNRMIQDSYAGYEEAEAAAKKGGAAK